MENHVTAPTRDEIQTKKTAELRSMLVERSRTLDSNRLDYDIRLLRGEIRALSEIPLCRLEVTLQSLCRKNLGPLGKATLDLAFMFNDDTEKRVAFVRSYGLTFDDKSLFDKLEPLYKAGKIKRVRLNRRFAGEQNLPQGCYYSICQEEHFALRKLLQANSEFGDDRQTLSRELSEYADTRIPGHIFLTDTTDYALASFVQGGLTFCHGLLVFMLAPLEENGTAAKTAWRDWYAPVLRLISNADANLAIAHIPTLIRRVIIDGVLDLRRPTARAWLWQNFAYGDRAVYLRTKPFVRFEAMLPHLMHPEFGGSTLTDGIGSWLRTIGVSGLVYPSARSDVAVVNGDNDSIIASYGWNFVDYRDADYIPDSAFHVDPNEPYEFQEFRGNRPRLVTVSGGWRVEGNELRWKLLRRNFEQLLSSL